MFGTIVIAVVCIAVVLAVLVTVGVILWLWLVAYCLNLMDAMDDEFHEGDACHVSH